MVGDLLAWRVRPDGDDLGEIVIVRGILFRCMVREENPRIASRSSAITNPQYHLRTHGHANRIMLLQQHSLLCWFMSLNRSES
jgi:hypothetical protein